MNLVLTTAVYNLSECIGNATCLDESLTVQYQNE